MKHYGSTAIQYRGGRQLIAFASCSCGWKSKEEVYDLNVLKESDDVRDAAAIIGALVDIPLNHHLRCVRSQTCDT